jgi:hypothetical protein
MVGPPIFLERRMDAQDETTPETPKKKAPATPPAPKPKPEGMKVKALRKTHIDPYDIIGFPKQEIATSIRLVPGQTLDNLKTEKAEALIAKGILSAV